MGEGAGFFTRKWALNGIPGMRTLEAGGDVDRKHFEDERQEYARKNLRQKLMHEVHDAVLEMTKKGEKTLSDMINEICTRFEEKRAIVESGIAEEDISGDLTFTRKRFENMVKDMLTKEAKKVLRGNSKIADDYNER